MIDKNCEHGVFPFVGEMGGNSDIPTVSVIIPTLNESKDLPFSGPASHAQRAGFVKYVNAQVTCALPIFPAYSIANRQTSKITQKSVIELVKNIKLVKILD